MWFLKLSMVKNVNKIVSNLAMFNQMQLKKCVNSPLFLSGNCTFALSMSIIFFYMHQNEKKKGTIKYFGEEYLKIL